MTRKIGDVDQFPHAHFRDAATSPNFYIVGYYAAYALGFPAHARATGVGFVLSVGRLGAAGSPILTGTLFDYFGKSELMTISIIMAMGSVVSAVLFLLLPIRDADAEAIKNS